MKLSKLSFLGMCFTNCFVCAVVLCILSCKQPKEKDKIFTKASSIINDSIATWLLKDSNFNKQNHLGVFYENYNKRIKDNNINGAAILLNTFAIANENHSLDNDSIAQTIIAFLTKYEKIVDTKYVIALNQLLGQQLVDKGRFIQAITFLEKAISYNATNYYGYVELGSAYYYLAICYREIGKPDAAFIANTKALECYEKTDSKRNIPSLYDNIANLHLFAFNYGEAIRSIDKALDITKASNQLNDYYSLLITKAEIYFQSTNKKYYPIADSLYKYCIVSKKTSSLGLKTQAYRFYANMLIEEKMFEKAKAIIDTMASLLSTQKNSDEFYTYINTLSNYELAIGKPITSRTYFEEEIVSLYEQKDYYNLLSNYEILKDDAKIRKDYKAAFNYQSKITTAEDSLFSKRNKIIVQDLEKKYETNKKEHQILLQKEELIGKSKTIALLFAAIGLIGLAALAFRYWQSRKKIKIEKQMSENYTKQLLEKTEEERKRIATDLHDSISHELMSLKNSNTEEFAQVNKKIDTIINDIRIISRNLHPVLFDKVGLQLTIEQMVERVQMQNNFMLIADINYSNSLSSAKELQVYRILQEAINNMVKYANAVAGKITITEDDKKVNIEIKDNGNGFNVAETLASNKSFGLHNIIERSKAIGGEAKIVSSTNGTIININIAK